VDVGTTRCKAVLFDEDGSAVAVASRSTPIRRDKDGSFYDAEELWGTVASAMEEVAASAGEVAAVGVGSMAETGLLVDRRTGEPRSIVIPWFDPRSARQGEALGCKDDPLVRFRKSGLRPSFKHGLAKLMWLREKDPEALKGSIWLSAADYVVFRLTGEARTDHSLAGRTYAFDIQRREWDEEWIERIGLDPGLFPVALPAGVPAGGVRSSGVAGLPGGVPVAVSGHDHLCAALGVGAVRPGVVLDSMGTAEALVGAVEGLDLGEEEWRSGLDFGCHVVPERHSWMGGMRSSGGSVEWMRARLAEEPLSYEEVVALAEEADEGPTGILYYPYLSGGGAVAGSGALGGLIGLKSEHGRAELMKAVLEGTAYEMEVIRGVAESVTGNLVEKVLGAGGGTRNPIWMRIKTDVSGCRYEVPRTPEATALGAAVAAGIGCGLYGSVGEAVERAAPEEKDVVIPDEERSRAYRRVYEEGYLRYRSLLDERHAISDRKGAHER
jgi:sugar (pentulose or hexulose) kinase